MSESSPAANVAGARRTPLARARVVAAIAIAVLAGWLGFDSQAWRRVERCFAAGGIGGLSREDQEAFDSALKWLMRAVPELADVRVNDLGAAREAKSLRIYTVTGSGYNALKCERGNALYDSRLDSVLIDAELVRGWLLSEFGTNELFSQRKVYTLFLLLHEIGHKIKHGSRRSTYGMLGTSEGEKRLEDEADLFALERLCMLADHPLVAKPESEDALARVWRLPVGSYSLCGFDIITDLPRPGEALGMYPRPSEEDLALAKELQQQPYAVRRDLFFLSWIHATTRAAMRADGVFSSLHSDASHDALFRRLGRVLQTYLLLAPSIAYEANRGGGWAERSSAIMAVKQQLNAYEIMDQAPLTEVTFPEPIEDIAWSGKHLFVATRDGCLYRIDDANLLGSKHGLTKRACSSADAVAKVVNDTDWNGFGARLLPWRGESVRMARDDGLYTIDKGLWRLAAEGALSELDIEQYVTDESASGLAVAVTGDRRKKGGSIEKEQREPELLVLGANGEVLSRRAVADIERDVSVRLEHTDLRLDAAVIWNEGTWMAAWAAGAEGPLVGFARLDLGSLQVQGVVRLRGDAPDAPASAAMVAVRPTVALSAAIAAWRSGNVAGGRTGVVSDPVMVGWVDADGATLSSSEVRVDSSRVVCVLPAYAEYSVSGIDWLGADRVLVRPHEGGMAVVLDVKTGAAKPAFFPSSHLARVGPAGRVAFVPTSDGEASLGADANGDYRCYVVDLGVR